MYTCVYVSVCMCMRETDRQTGRGRGRGRWWRACMEVREQHSESALSVHNARTQYVYPQGHLACPATLILLDLFSFFNAGSLWYSSGWLGTHCPD